MYTPLTIEPPVNVYARFCVFVWISRSSRHQLPWYPNFMLCAPVTYDVLKNQFAPSVALTSQLCDRYVISPTLPCGLITVAASVMRTRFSVGFGSCSLPPQ